MAWTPNFVKQFARSCSILKMLIRKKRSASATLINTLYVTMTLWGNKLDMLFRVCPCNVVKARQLNSTLPSCCFVHDVILDACNTIPSMRLVSTWFEMFSSLQQNSFSLSNLLTQYNMAGGGGDLFAMGWRVSKILVKGPICLWCVVKILRWYERMPKANINMHLCMIFTPWWKIVHTWHCGRVRLWWRCA